MALCLPFEHIQSSMRYLLEQPVTPRLSRDQDCRSQRDHERKFYSPPILNILRQLQQAGTLPKGLRLARRERAENLRADETMLDQEASRGKNGLPSARLPFTMAWTALYQQRASQPRKPAPHTANILNSSSLSNGNEECIYNQDSSYDGGFM